MAAERILVTDDEELILQLCERVLTKAGYEVQMATDALQAIQACEINQFDILLTDIKMTGLDGLHLIEVVKKFQPRMVPMVITGHGTIDTAIESLRLGVLAFIMKPFTPKTLLDTVRSVLEKRELLRQNGGSGKQLPLFEITASKAWIDGDGGKGRCPEKESS